MNNSQKMNIRFERSKNKISILRLYCDRRLGYTPILIAIKERYFSEQDLDIRIPKFF